ncbi:SIR2 family protein [Microbacterium plantarum]|uniref:SIR2 family protein n=1 Tax=Microbacterium plantarum TaxID=1816425 RepID=UPI002B49B0FA|nr:SIR2 family protein [Microbacterium plantarum]WRK16236.1 SIR2 family protein [Microbacterium plantarum]
MHDWVASANGKTLVLLGAGASAPSLPVSRELTDLVIESMNERLDDHPGYLKRAWELAREQLRGTSNIEEFYSSLSDVEHQDEDTTRHWVKEWVPLPGVLPADGDSVSGRQSFGFLAHMVQNSVMTILAAKTELADKSYLHSLVAADVRGTVTLNYDLMVEKAAVEAGRAYTTGAEQWDGGVRWFADELGEGVLPVLKLHGSLNWRETRVVIGSPLPIVGFEEVGGNGRGAGKLLARLDEPAICGLSGKMSPYDPYPALRSQFDRMLEEVELLVVVGFSFWDAHITAPIRRWLALDDRRRIIVVDPYFDPVSTPIRVLVDALCLDCVIDGNQTLAAGLGIDRMQVLTMTAEEGLDALFAR